MTTSPHPVRMELRTTLQQACPAHRMQEKEDAGHAAFDARNATNNVKVTRARPASDLQSSVWDGEQSDLIG